MHWLEMIKIYISRLTYKNAVEILLQGKHPKKRLKLMELIRCYYCEDLADSDFLFEIKRKRIEGLLINKLKNTKINKSEGQLLNLASSFEANTIKYIQKYNEHCYRNK